VSRNLQLTLFIQHLCELCRQFHQRFTRAFFVRNVGAKNHKAERYQRKAAEKTCIRKRRSYNVDEIDTFDLISQSSLPDLSLTRRLNEERKNVIEKKQSKINLKK